MKIRVRIPGRDDPEGALLKLAGVSAAAHAVALIIFAFLPRFTSPPPPPRHIVANIVPASAILPAAPRPAAAPRKGPTPSERAETAKKALQRKATPEPPKPPPKKPPAPKKPAAPRKDPATPPPEPRTPPVPAEDPTTPPPEPDPPTEPEREAAPEPAGSPPGAFDEGGITFGSPDAGDPGGGIPTIGSSAFPYDYYRASLVTILQSNWRRPLVPEGLEEPQVVAVGFTIMRTGTVRDPQIVESSGNPALDRSALRAVIDSNPLPPLPFQYGRASVKAVVHFKLTNK